MEKLECKSEEFLAFDPWGQPVLLSRTGAFVEKAAEEKAQTLAAPAQNTPKNAAQAPRATGSTRFFGSMDQFRSRLLPKTKAA